MGGQETGLGGISWSCVGPASRKFQSSLLHELPELKKGGTPKPRSTTTPASKTTFTCCLVSNMTPLKRAMLIQKRNKGRNLLPISSPLTLHPPHLTLTYRHSRPTAPLLSPIHPPGLWTACGNLRLPSWVLWNVPTTRSSRRFTLR